MASKKVIIFSVLIGIVLIFVLLPIFIYGTSVKTSEFDIKFSISSSNPTSSSIQIQASENYIVSNASVNYKEKEMNPYEYAFMRLSGNQVQTKEEDSTDTSVADIQITFKLTTPSGKNLTFSFDPQELRGTGEKHIVVTMGPEDLNGETGTFTLTIIIKITITPPNFDKPVVDKELNPITLQFEVPK
ncbi:MAG: hypothetical protein ACP6IY_17685 [Promethearchaeia archaeon]